ncbi:autotransporter assembly complex protein TamA [Agarivorans sp.]|uniref:autotransporter assembly complex protein TamA n=1 Tax=Agarivorans sp. TaxID=1872412 RepID=UPI003D089909
MFLRCWPILLVLFTSTVAALEFSYQGLSDEAEDNVKVYLEAQNFPEHTSRRRIISASLEQADLALRALGYYQSKIQISEQEKGRFLVSVDQGRPLIISQFNFQFSGEATQDSRFTSAVSKSGLAEGAVFSHVAYDKLKSEFNHLASRYGYFDAQFHQAEIKISIKRNTAVINLNYDSGARYHFGDVVFTNPELPRTMFANLAEFSEKDRYDSQLVGEFNQRLGDTDYFQVISVRPDIENRHDNKIDILVGLQLKHRDIFEVGGGITTDVGPRARLKWNRPWVNMRGHSVTLELEGSEPKQSAQLVYRIPIANPVDDYVDVQSGFIREKTNDTESEKTIVSTTRQWRLEGDWQPAIFLKWQHERYKQAEQSSVTDLVLPGANFARLRTRGGLDPHWGDNLQASVELGHPYWGSDVELLRFAALAKWLRSYQNHRLLVRFDLGGIWVDDISDVPASMRFFAGGDQSIRGYDYKTIAPRNENGQLIGGKFLTVGSLEYNYQFAEKWRWATFVDAGTATNDFSEPVSLGVGMGIRWLTLIGPLRVDLAAGLQNESDAWRLHFSLGPDL